MPLRSGDLPVRVPAIDQIAVRLSPCLGGMHGLSPCRAAIAAGPHRFRCAAEEALAQMPCLGGCRVSGSRRLTAGVLQSD